ncbi:hypothetical protein SNEBB_001469 [Seison nebaliae]|nr:hypothetical protein SNEBB_001469 [Seison nebaliae]
MVQIDEHSKFFGEVLEELALYKLSSSIAVSKWIADNAFIEDKLEVIASHNISNVSYESKINLELLQLIMKSINAIIIFTQNGIACNGSAALNILVGYLCKVNLPKNMNYPSLFHNLFRYVEKFINASETIPLSLATNLIKFIHYLFIIDQSQALQQFVYHQFRMSSIICVFRHPQRYFGTNKDFKSLHVHLLQILVFCLNKSHYAETFLLEVRRKVRKIVMDTGFFQFQLHNLLSILIMHHWKNDQNDLVNIIVEIFLPLYSHTFNFYLRKLREENFSLSCSKCTTPIINHLTEQTLFFNILLKIPKYICTYSQAIYAKWAFVIHPTNIQKFSRDLYGRILV